MKGAKAEPDGRERSEPGRPWQVWSDFQGLLLLLRAALFSLFLLAVEGNSDELDEPIKAVFADVAFVQRHNLMSLNSINWSRILVQMAHHFFAYFQCAPSLDAHTLPPVEVVVPTGAAGNLAAGCIAQKMGLPISLVVTVNRNDIIHRTVQRGDFSLCEAVKPTLASAMDIQVGLWEKSRSGQLLVGQDWITVGMG